MLIAYQRMRRGWQCLVMEISTPAISGFLSRSLPDPPSSLPPVRSPSLVSPSDGSLSLFPAPLLAVTDCLGEAGIET